MPYTTEQKNKIYTWLESKKPANFDASQYYKYFVNSYILYFGAGPYYTALAICLFINSGNKTNTTPKNIKNFINTYVPNL